ncbi:cell envelope integrity protein TolA [Pseudoteredinibacter isoporae]|uniref:Colicin import membrane protein n=1 Tax=Pseudoteredinibacter isoporae TaxID=570281 RepID=A0A7X0JW96_9GAMM|nr:cell envelope integrity protein TolA [Pseudoteredinibacter isoporae]MBB6522893.1 colicin import membrane protein [Pseudoteredinibacter isoporae]NHO88419.1 cell envelope integrity protein TolA [Pseudoteredinibacter isoporae]NIB23250.1 cell envelope integrity protein TolA [Pseudoteredinibacter isoporae]
MRANQKGLDNHQAGFGGVGILVSVLLHALLLVAVLCGWESSEEPQKRRVTPKYVQAKLVEVKPKSKPKPAAKPKQKIIDLTKKRKEAERRKRLEQEKAKKLAREKAEKDRKAKAAREKAAKDKAAREKAAREKAAREKAAKEKAEQVAREQELQRQIDQEMQAEREALLAEQQAEEDQMVAQSFIGLIAQRVENNWSRPASARKGMQVELRIQLVPTGRVINVTVVKSSGNAAFDRSAEQAVKKAEQFPELKKLPPAVFERNFRQLRLVFNPKDLRL